MPGWGETRNEARCAARKPGPGRAGVSQSRLGLWQARQLGPVGVGNVQLARCQSKPYRRFLNVPLCGRIEQQHFFQAQAKPLLEVTEALIGVRIAGPKLRFQASPRHEGRRTARPAQDEHAIGQPCVNIHRQRRFRQRMEHAHVDGHGRSHDFTKEALGQL
ncbi:hypothetical protein G6F59_013827 [Rhizopus arrhizus]|nr:hypothetical protein G6F24_016885 [Rhizopus arrhizus]KAG1396324.1 hypothetical protein G6F59_013827 [Rhizopus arrhizus]